MSSSVKKKTGDVKWCQEEDWECQVVPRRGLVMSSGVKKRIGDVKWCQEDDW